MSPYHGEESPFEAAFRLNAAPLIARLEKLERQVKKLKRLLPDRTADRDATAKPSKTGSTR